MWVYRDIEEPGHARSELDHGAFLTSMVPESRRYIQRYVGHANVQTDIKEVTYLGSNDELVAAGEEAAPFCGTTLPRSQQYARLFTALIVPGSRDSLPKLQCVSQ